MIDDTQEQQVVETPVAEEPAEQQPVETPADKNFKALREKADRATRERDEALAEVRRAKQEAERLKQESLNSTLTPDQREIQKLKQDFEQYKVQSHETLVEARLHAQHPDFNSVVSQENVAALKEAYPEIAATLQSSPDLYTAAVSAYTMIKKFGIHKDTSSADKAQTQSNMSKPRPASSVSVQTGQGALSHANEFASGLTPELKNKLYQEMLDSQKSY
jgi:hypothetical protein